MLGIDPSRRLSKLDEAAEEKLQRKSMKKPNNKIVSSNYEKLEDDEVWIKIYRLGRKYKMRVEKIIIVK